MQKILSALLAVAASVSLSLPARSQASAPPNQIQFSVQVVNGMQNQYPDVLLQYEEPTTTTCQFAGSTTLAIPAASTNNAINLATLFPGFVSPVVIGLQEITSPSLPVNIGLSTTSPRLQLAPGGVFVVRTAAGMPTLYVDNPSANSIALVRVFLLSN